MRKRFSALLAVATVAGATPAVADGGWSSGGVVCGGSNFQTCATVSISWTTAGVVTLVATNNGVFGEVWKTVAIANLPAGWNYSYTFSGPAGRNYSGNAGLTGDGIPVTAYGAEADAPPTGKGLQNGETGTWTFTFSNFTNFDSEMADSYFAVHAISGPPSISNPLEDCSTKLWIGPNGQHNDGPYDADCSQTVVPEPGSMILLATGLVGLAGAGVIRRRRNRA